MGSPTYMGSVSWQFKKFADASSKPWFTQAWKDKVFAGFTNSATMNGDKLSTLHYLFTLAMQHGGIWVGTGMMPSNSKAAQRNDVNYVGFVQRCHGAKLTSRRRCRAGADMPCRGMTLPGDGGRDGNRPRCSKRAAGLFGTQFRKAAKASNSQLRMASSRV
jgi:multimeric flavodoxin WrbA